MALTLDTYLKNSSYEYYISNGTLEQQKIDNSIAVIKKYLIQYFGNKILDIRPFGSYTRDTILPREYDENSDVDIMIVFNHEECGVQPATYRNWLQDFANSKYPRTDIIKDFPTVVVDMNHIKFDLVPTIIEEYWLFGKVTVIKIPDSNNKWQNTEPDEFNEVLRKANVEYNSLVKPIIRLLKVWNCNNSYPYSSFELEQIIANMNFAGDNYQSGFFYAIDKLPTYNLSLAGEQKVKSLQMNKARIVESLKKEEYDNAKYWLHKIIPSW